MFRVIYSFKIKEGLVVDFEKSWHDLTLLIYENCGSLGSILHKTDNELEYIAYAHWPDKGVFESSKLPEEAISIIDKMRSTCDSIEIISKMKVLVDLSKDNIFNYGK